MFDVEHRTLAVVNHAAAALWEAGAWSPPAAPLPDIRPAPPPAAALGAVTRSLTIAYAGRRIHIASRLANPAPRAITRLAHLAVAADGAIDHQVELAEHAGALHLHADGRPVASARTQPELAGELNAYLIQLAAGPALPVLLVHAAALVVAGVPMLLSARSGGGKSTLAVALAHAGATLLGDDLAAIRASDHALFGFPSAVRVRGAGWTLAQRFLSPEARATPPNRFGARLFAPAALGATALSAGPVGACIAIERVAGAAPQLTPLGEAEGLAMLAANGASLPREASPAQVAQLAAWCAATRFLRLSYDTPEDAVAALQSLAHDLA